MILYYIIVPLAWLVFNIGFRVRCEGCLLYTSCGWLYNVAVGGRRETRGSVAFLLPMGALALLLFLDLRFPLLFWNLRHGLEVSGGEPTDWYYSMQRMGRITDIVGIFVLARCV